MMKKIYFMLPALALMMLLPAVASAQTDRKDVRRGNRDYRKQNWKEAEIDYRKALVKDSMSVAANYNLAADLYRQGDAQGAMKSMQKVEQGALEGGHGADYYYNLGDMSLAAKDYKTAVDAFAKSLLMRPDDLDAKENYIYARKMLENQQQNGGGGGQGDQNKDNQDQDRQSQDNQDQNRNQDNNDKNSQDKNDKNSQDKNDNGDGQNDDRNQENNDGGQQPPQDNRDGQGQPQEQKISPQAAQQMLQAIQAKEKETQDKVNKEKAAMVRSRQKEKNW